ncbi:hypothetical protein MAR_036035, partial [Mya arenaria]
MESLDDKTVTSISHLLVKYLCPCSRTSSIYDLHNDLQHAENADSTLGDDQIITSPEVTTFQPRQPRPPGPDTEDLLEPAPDIEIPPPMPVQDQTHMLSLGKTDTDNNIAEKI